MHVPGAPLAPPPPPAGYNSLMIAHPPHRIVRIQLHRAVIGICARHGAYRFANVLNIAAQGYGPDMSETVKSEKLEKSASSQVSTDVFSFRHHQLQLRFRRKGAITDSQITISGLSNGFLK